MSLKWRFLHRWLGLSVGLVFSIVCLSGSLLLHKSNLMGLLHPELKSALRFSVEDAKTVDHAVIDAMLLQTDKKPLAVVLPKPDWPLYTQVYSKTQRAYFDRNGQFLVALDSQSDLFAWAFDLHQNLLFGQTGKNINGWIQLMSLAMLLSGLLLWWPKRHFVKALKVDVAAPKRKLWYQLHRTSAVIALPLMLLMVLTGIGLLYYSQTKALLGALLNEADNRQTLALPYGSMINRDTPLKQVMQQAGNLWPDIRWTVIYLPNNSRPNWRLRGKFASEWHQNGRSFMTFSASDEHQVLLQSAKAAGTGLASAQKLYPIHSATIGGSWYLWLLTVIGIVPMFLWGSGVYLYLKKARPRVTAARQSNAAAPFVETRYR